MADFNKEKFMEKTKETAEKAAVLTKAAAGKTAVMAKNVMWEVKAAPDRTFEFSKSDISQNKLVSMLSYVPFAVLVPLFWSKITGKHSPYMQFHAKQGLLIFIIELLAALILGLFAKLPVIGFIFSIAKALVYICCAALAAKNIWDILNDKAIKLPYIDRINWFKMFMK